ncbi:MAG: hypothetical protein MUF15_20845 [Acidobacteria bacterium]|jgi:nucleoid DNA-binding protein|nr:hypothetical protein [Acidobacteriota bacterium]
MANKIEAINAYRPKLVLGKTIVIDQLVQFIADRTGLNRGDVRHMLDEFQDTLVFFALNGQGVKLEALGTFLPKINTKGKISMSTRIATGITNRLNQTGAYRGGITNRENIGKTTAEFITMWNTDHPEDPVV